MISLTIEVLFHTKYGEELYISGNTDQLGNWKIEKALHMFTNEEKYPLWGV